jgi:hypothetical protein
MPIMSFWLQLQQAYNQGSQVQQQSGCARHKNRGLIEGEPTGIIIIGNITRLVFFCNFEDSLRYSQDLEHETQKSKE